MIHILGNGPFARELKCYCIERFGQNVHVELVDKNSKYVPTVDPFSCYYGTYLGSGKPSIKIEMSKKLYGPLGETISFGHFSKFSSHGQGSVFAHGSVVSSHTQVGNHVLINYNATVGHDCLVEDFVSIGPTAAIGGNVRIEKGVYIGAGALIRENLTIGEGAIIGMGAVVTKDVPAGVTVCGIPAKPVTRVGGWQ